MLRLKRASAGSGKTYQLAKTFIKLLLTIKLPGKKRRLRSKEELSEALRSIMAVTFTVKATAEMKQRIVDKLAALADADSKSGDELKKIDYLEELIEETNSPSKSVTKDDIAYVAKDALRTLLLHFSDFKVQTIDSFFQSVLHTFVYEANLDENFNMELDTDYVSTIGLDAALDAIISADRRTGDPEILFWLRQIIGKGKTSSSWNVFAKREGRYSKYSGLIKQAKNLDQEDFQNKRNRIENYFLNLKGPFREVVKLVDEANMAPWISLYEARKKAAMTMVEELDRCHLDISAISRNPAGKLKESLADFDIETLVSEKPAIPKPGKDCSGTKFLSGVGKDRFKEVKRTYPDITDSSLDGLRSAYLDWSAACKEIVETYANPVEGKALKTWLAYLQMMPEMMLVLEIAKQKR